MVGLQLLEKASAFQRGGGRPAGFHSLFHLSHSSTMSGGGGGGGCNILEIFCKRKSKEIAVFDIEDKATTEAAATADGTVQNAIYAHGR